MNGFNPNGITDAEAAIPMITPDQKHSTDYSEPKEQPGFPGWMGEQYLNITFVTIQRFSQ